MALQDAIAALQVIVNAVSGIRQAPEYPPDGVMVYPTAIAYASNGTWTVLTKGGAKALHTLVLDVLFDPTHLPAAVKEAMRLSDALPKAILADPTLGGTVETFGMISYEFRPLPEWGEPPPLGWRLRLDNVKVLTAL